MPEKAQCESGTATPRHADAIALNADAACRPTGATSRLHAEPPLSMIYRLNSIFFEERIRLRRPTRSNAERLMHCPAVTTPLCLFIYSSFLFS